MSDLAQEDFLANPHSAKNAKFDCASREWKSLGVLPHPFGCVGRW
jgi:hypothetical protein